MSKKLASFASPAPPGKLAQATIRRVNPPPAEESALRELVGGEVHASKRRRTEAGERVTVILPPELLKRLRMAAVDEGCSVSHAVTEAVQAWLAGDAPA